MRQNPLGRRATKFLCYQIIEPDFQQNKWLVDMKQNLKNWKHYHPCVFVEHNFLWQLKWHLVLRNFMAVITFPLLLWSWLCWLNILICFRLRLNLTIMVGLIRSRFITTLDDMLGSLQVSLLSSHSLQHLLKTKRSPHSQILIWAGQLSSVIIGPLTPINIWDQMP